MDNKLAILGGSPAIAMDHDTFAFDLEIVLDGIAARLERATTGD